MPVDFATLPLREIRKGRALQWDPHAIALAQDRVDWLTLSAAERELLLSQILGFLVGEKAVAHDLAPLQQALRRERGHTEEEMYLTQQQFEESTHVEFFQRWINEVLPGKLKIDIPVPRGEYTPIIRDILPRAMTALVTDISRAAQLEAVIVYHQVVEGVLAEVGYQVFYDCIDSRGILPGLREGLRRIQTDEARHIAFGTYLARRILNENPELRERFIARMEELRPVSRASTEALFAPWEEPYPFGLDKGKALGFCDTLHRRRLDAVLNGVEVEA